MGCKTCGSGAPCGCKIQPCAQPLFANDSCCSGEPTQCCDNTCPSAPTPYFACAPACPESHTQKVVINQFATSVKITSSWNIPACGDDATVFVPGLKQAVVGSYIWNGEFGYFEITAFDSGTGQITVVNHCNDGNAAAGTNVPACTEFIITDPPVDSEGGSGVCVAIDFTAPEVDTCLDITLTGTTGLTAGDTIQIGTGFYFLEAIKPNDIVTICNQGEGILPGTPVIAQDSSGQYQYCLSIISTNPCDRTAELTAPVLGCNEDGVAVPIAGQTPGYVLVLIDSETNEAEYRPLGLPSDCTHLTAPLNAVNGDATYTIAVESSAGFAIGEIITFSGFDVDGSNPRRFEITGVPDGTHLDGTLTPTPGSNYSIPLGTLVCTVGCCEKLQDQFNNLDAFKFDTSTGFAAGSITPGGANVSVSSSVVVSNLGNPNALHVLYSVESSASMTFVSTGDQQCLPIHSIKEGINVPAVVVATEIHCVPLLGTGGTGRITSHVSATHSLTVPANSSTTINFGADCNMSNAGLGMTSVTGSVTGSTFSARISGIAVAVDIT